MKNSKILLVFLVFLGCFSATRALAATHNIYVAALGASVHEVVIIPWQDDHWTDGSVIPYAHYTDTAASGGALGWSDVSFQFNLSELAGSRDRPESISR